MAESKINILTPIVVQMDKTAGHHANITNVERQLYIRYGKLIVVDLTFTVGTAITGNTEEIFSGFPANYSGNMRFRLPHGNDGSKPDLVLAITSNGKIINQYTNGGLQTGQYQGSFSYISA